MVIVITEPVGEEDKGVEKDVETSYRGSYSMLSHGRVQILSMGICTTKLDVPKLLAS